MTTGQRILLPMIVLALAHCAPARAHEVRPAYLEMRETVPGTFSILWKVPARSQELRLGLYVRLPEDCVKSVEPVGIFTDNAHTQRWQVTCATSVDGRKIEIEGLASMLTDVLVRVERANGTVQVDRALPSRPFIIVQATPGLWQVSRTYLSLGIEHILLGIDHLLFVLALLFLVHGAWPLTATITAFTVAHSLTLAGATLGYVYVPTLPVEACIALSIVFVSAEILRVQRGIHGVTTRAPWLVAFLFGLLHGLGFASALHETGLPQGAIPAALLFFNIGVELGQLAFIAAVLGTILLASKVVCITIPAGIKASEIRRRAQFICAYAIGTVSAFWVLERFSAFWAV